MNSTTLHDFSEINMFDTILMYFEIHKTFKSISFIDFNSIRKFTVQVASKFLA